MSETTDKVLRQRAPKRYWREVKGNLYARLQYQDSNGKWKEKLKPISDKRLARGIVEEMCRELELHGEETLQSDKLIFSNLADKYVETKLIDAEY